MPIGYSAVLLPQLQERNDSLATDADMGSWIASVHSLASPVGSFLSGSLMDRCGRLRALQISVAPLIGGWVLLGCAPSHAVLLAGRLVAGFAVGLMAPPSQVFLGEISEPRLRGTLIGAPFVSYSLGILLVYALGSSLHWRAVAGAATVLPALALLAMCLMPESPVWLVRKEKRKRAEKALLWLRGDEKLNNKII
ncbi:facilitated trehalose transporter Tret1-like [Ctenocephalides felis]|uniref:facilitated trehalose transporter Tret1-like n=1 Tax=Ctenocephalides felis TaxID=7515 RepID=UPI000E6E11B4|nr:facilitated trehalose transporter Tret1-like [Ctenocephalides felis]